MTEVYIVEFPYDGIYSVHSTLEKAVESMKSSEYEKELDVYLYPIDPSGPDFDLRCGKRIRDKNAF